LLRVLDSVQLSMAVVGFMGEMSNFLRFEDFSVNLGRFQNGVLVARAASGLFVFRAGTGLFAVVDTDYVHII